MIKLIGICLLLVLLLTACTSPADEGSTPEPTSPVQPTGSPSPAGAPAVPHSLEGRTDCLSCHEEGTMGANQIPANHSGFSNAACLKCHQAPQ